MAALYITDSAAARYVEQVKPLHSIEQAREEMRALAEAGRYVEPPTWVHGGRWAGRRYLEVSDGIVFSIVADTGTVCTVLTRAQHAVEVRRARNSAKKARKRERRFGVQRIKGRKQQPREHEVTNALAEA